MEPGPLKPAESLRFSIVLFIIYVYLHGAILLSWEQSNKKKKSHPRDILSAERSMAPNLKFKSDCSRDFIRSHPESGRVFFYLSSAVL